MIFSFLLLLVSLLIISVIVARGGVTGSLVLTLVSLFTGTVLGAVISVPVILLLFVYAGFNPVTGIFALFILTGCIMLTSVAVYLMGLLTMGKNEF